MLFLRALKNEKQYLLELLINQDAEQSNLFLQITHIDGDSQEKYLKNIKFFSAGSSVTLYFTRLRQGLEAKQRFRANIQLVTPSALCRRKLPCLCSNVRQNLFEPLDLLSYRVQPQKQNHRQQHNGYDNQ